MDIIQFCRTYGENATRELLDIIFIRKIGTLSAEEWRQFCIKHGIIKRTTKKMIVSNNYFRLPHQYQIRLCNGLSKEVLYLCTNDEDIDLWRGLLA